MLTKVLLFYHLRLSECSKYDPSGLSDFPAAPYLLILIPYAVSKVKQSLEYSRHNTKAIHK